MSFSNRLRKDREQRKEARFECYQKALDDIVTKIYHQQSVGGFVPDPHWKDCCLQEPIDKEYLFPAQQPYYSQSECVDYIIDRLRELGFFAKSMKNKTCVFVSYHPSHLEIIETKREKAEQAQAAKVAKEQEAAEREREAQLEAGKRTLLQRELQQELTYNHNHNHNHNENYNNDNQNRSYYSESPSESRTTISLKEFKELKESKEFKELKEKEAKTNNKALLKQKKVPRYIDIDGNGNEFQNRLNLTNFLLQNAKR